MLSLAQQGKSNTFSCSVCRDRCQAWLLVLSKVAIRRYSIRSFQRQILPEHSARNEWNPIPMKRNLGTARRCHGWLLLLSALCIRCLPFEPDRRRHSRQEDLRSHDATRHFADITASIARRQFRVHEARSEKDELDPPSTSGLLSTTISLGLIVGSLMLIGHWMKRIWISRLAIDCRSEAFEVLGRRVLEPRVAVQIVKCGSRILVLGIGAGDIRTLSGKLTILPKSSD